MKMAGWRKIILGSEFVLCASFLIWTGIKSGSDLAALSATILAMAGGVAAVVYGNVKEHQAGINSNEPK
jgi:hypothetical protein